MKRKIVLFSVLLILIGCAAEPPPDDPIAAMLETRAKAINGKLPIAVDGINLVYAQAMVGHKLALSFYQTDLSVDGEQFLQRYQQSLCQQPQVASLLTNGISYQLTLKNADATVFSTNITNCD